MMNHIQPPGPPGMPVLGVAPYFRRDRLKFVLDVAHQYGDVVKYNAFSITLYQINHPDAIQHVLQENNKNYEKGFEAFPTFDMTLGRGLLTNEGESWLKQRRLMSPVFHHRNIEAMSEMMTRRTLMLWEHWQKQAGQQVNVAAAMMQLTLGIVSEALFSANVSDKAAAVARAVTVLTEDTTLRFDFPFYPQPDIPTPHNRAFVRSLHELNDIIYGLIRERRAATGVPQTARPHDLLQLLLDARDPETGAAVGDKQLRDELVTLFLAGHETTANLLTWTFYLLSQHPTVAIRLRRELDSVLLGRTPTVSDLSNLPYTRCVLDEVLRLYPPAWVLNRTNLQDDELGGYVIPAHSLLAISPYVMHRHPQYWEDPDRFDPERFLPERSGERHRFVYFPFGGGPRLCIGRGFALVEAHLVLATLAQRAHLDLAPRARIEPQALVTLRSKYGMPMILQKRVL